MLKKVARINEETKQAEGIVLDIDDDRKTAVPLIEADVEQDYKGNWYLVGYLPELTKEEISEQRHNRYIEEADPLKLDYDEALARGASNTDELKDIWLAKKDEIRTALPYPVGK